VGASNKGVILFSFSFRERDPHLASPYRGEESAINKVEHDALKWFVVGGATGGTPKSRAGQKMSEHEMGEVCRDRAGVPHRRIRRSLRSRPQQTPLRRENPMVIYGWQIVLDC
jgi:hypothetical protein